MNDFRIIPENETHFPAHEKEMLQGGKREGELRLAVKYRRPVGYSALRRVSSGNRFHDGRILHATYSI